MIDLQRDFYMATGAYADAIEWMAERYGVDVDDAKAEFCKMLETHSMWVRSLQDGTLNWQEHARYSLGDFV